MHVIQKKKSVWKDYWTTNFMRWQLKYCLISCTCNAHHCEKKKVRHVSLPIVKFSHDGSIVSIYLKRIVIFRLYIISFMNILTRPINLHKKKEDEYFCHPNALMDLFANIWYINLYQSFITSISQSLLMSCVETKKE